MAKGVNAGGSIIYIYTARTRTPADPFWLNKKKGKKIKLTSTHEKKESWVMLMRRVLRGRSHVALTDWTEPLT